jgi:hypothetical protein
MKNLRGVLGGLLIVVIFQFTLVSCVDNSEIIKNDNVQIQKSGKEEEPDPGDRGLGN